MVGDSESMMIASMWASMAAWFTPTVLFCLMNLIIATIFIANNNNKHHGHGQNQGYGDHYVQEESSSRLPVVSSLFERARSVNLPSYIATITGGESIQLNHSQLKKATYSSLSRLAQSIHFPSTYTSTSNGGESFQSNSERKPPIQHGRGGSQLDRAKSIRFATVNSDDTVLTESQQISNSTAQLTQAPSLMDRVKSLKISLPSKSGAPSTQPENSVTSPGNNPNHHTIKSKSAKTGAIKPLVEIKKTRSEIRIPSDDEEDVDYRRPETARARLNADEEGVDAKADDFITRFRQQLKLQRVESLVRFNEVLNRRF